MKLEGLILTDKRGTKYRLVRLVEKDEQSKVEADFSKWLKSERKKIKLTQAQLAMRAGMLQPNICAYEKGTRKPNKDSLRKLREIFGSSQEE